MFRLWLLALYGVFFELVTTIMVYWHYDDPIDYFTWSRLVLNPTISVSVGWLWNLMKRTDDFKRVYDTRTGESYLKRVPAPKEIGEVILISYLLVSSITAFLLDAVGLTLPS